MLYRARPFNDRDLEFALKLIKKCAIDALAGKIEVSQSRHL